MPTTYKHGLSVLAFALIGVPLVACTYNDDELRAGHPNAGDSAVAVDLHGAADLPIVTAQADAGLPLDAAVADAPILPDAADMGVEAPPDAGSTIEIDAGTDGLGDGADAPVIQTIDSAIDQAVEDAALDTASESDTSDVDAQSGEAGSLDSDDRG